MQPDSALARIDLVNDPVVADPQFVLRPTLEPLMRERSEPHTHLVHLASDLVLHSRRQRVKGARIGRRPNLERRRHRRSAQGWRTVYCPSAISRRDSSRRALTSSVSSAWSSRYSSNQRRSFSTSARGSRGIAASISCTVITGGRVACSGSSGNGRQDGRRGLLPRSQAPVWECPCPGRSACRIVAGRSGSFVENHVPKLELGNKKNHLVMLDKIKAVNNPLTIIAIFAALAEVAGTTALVTVDKDLQHTFVWFVMGFPSLLVFLFFLTLNFNPKVLYAPSDFRDESNFINTLVGTREVSISLNAVTEQLEQAKEAIVSQALKRIDSAGADSRARLSQVVSEQLAQIQLRVDSTRAAIELVASEASEAAFPNSNLQSKILKFFGEQTERYHSASTIAHGVQMSIPATEKALRRLKDRGLVDARFSETDDFFALANSQDKSQ